MSRETTRIVVQFTLICIVAYLLGYYFTFIFNAETANVGGIVVCDFGNSSLSGNRKRNPLLPHFFALAAR